MSMRNVLVIGHHDTKVFLRDRTVFIWLLLMPLLFVGFMGFAVRGPGGPAFARPAVVIDNQDSGFLGRIFLRELGEQGLTIVDPATAGDAKRGITIPADFTEKVLAKDQSKLDFFKVTDVDDQDSGLVEVRLVRAVVAMNGHLIEHAARNPREPPSEQALDALIDAPKIVTLQSTHAGRKPRPVGFSFSLPGNLVMYLLLNTMIFGAASVAEQRRTGVLRRIAINPITGLELLFGKIYGLLLLAAVQIIFFLIVGQFFLGVDIAAGLPGIVLTLLIFSWVAASLGLLIGFLVQAEDKVIGLSLAIALPAAALGGCWWPLEIAPRFLQNAALAVPTGWALKALHQLITFGSGIPQILTPLAVLVAFGVAANIAAVKFFRV